MKPAPLPGYQHSPMPAGRNTADHKSDEADLHSSPELAAQLRFKTIGIDTDMGRLHDLSCPAFHPETVSTYHPYASFKTVVDEGVFRRKALEAAAGKSLSEAMDMQQVWQAATLLKSADEAMINDIRLDLHKAFRDANPGPSTYPSPGCISPSRFHRPVISDGHAANSPGYGSPNSSPSVASGPVAGAGSFSKPPLSAGHQTPSPGFMKQDFDSVPSEPGVPTKLTYERMEKEQALHAIGRMHTHLMAMFPNICSMDLNSRGPQEPNPAISAVKDDEPEATKGAVEGITKAPIDTGLDDEFIEKAFKKMRKKLGKKVLSGKMTVDEARSKIGRMGTQKNADPDELLKTAMQAAAIDMVDAGELSVEDARKALGMNKPVPDSATKSDVAEVSKQIDTSLDYIQKTYGPDVIKSAIAEAVAPLTELLTAQRESFEAKIAEQQKVIDAIADSPDPRGEPFSGIAMNVNKSARPAGVAEVAENAERTQQMMIRQLDHTWRTTDNPGEREAAWAAMQKLRGKA
jgi:hypothetical protein